MVFRFLRHHREVANRKRRLKKGGKPRANRRLGIEQLEERQMLALSPELIAVIPNEGAILQQNDVRNIAPRELTFRFDDGQQIDPLSLGGITILRSGLDGSFAEGNEVNVTPGVGANSGFIGIGNSPNEVIVRFAETLPDDVYRITVTGNGPTPLFNTMGDRFDNDRATPALDDANVQFELNLGAQIVAVVPMPITRGAGGVLSQAKNQIVVHFNNDDLLDDATSAENTAFYQLIFTNDSATNRDDIKFNPTSVAYDPATDTAVLTFAADLDQLQPAAGAQIPAGGRTFRLRIGTEEVVARDQASIILPVAPQFVDLSQPGINPQLVIDSGGPLAPGDTIGTHHDLGTLTSQSVIVKSVIDPQYYGLELPGAGDSPGDRDIPLFSHLLTGADGDDGIATIEYNFQTFIGSVQGQAVQNLITDPQKQRAREIFEIYGSQLGVQFVETENRGITVATGDLALLGGFSFNGGVLGLSSFTQQIAVMDSQESWDDSFGFSDDPLRPSWFVEALERIGQTLGLGRTDELPPGTIMNSEAILRFTNPADPNFISEPIFPGDHDIVHGQHLYRPESKDIDLYRFVLDTDGLFSAVTIAERAQPSSSLLDTVITLFDASGNVIAQNDDYFSEDSFLELELTAGTYFIGVTSTGNDNYNVNVADSGFGGTTEGEYDLRLNFRPNVTTSIVDAGSVLQPALPGVAFDGDSDGAPGGVFNFWFRVQDTAHTFFVDKAAAAGGNGSLANPFNEIDVALAGRANGDVVRIVGNNQNLPYLIGKFAGNALADGATLEVPKGVTVMIDGGAIFKLFEARIGVGSSEAGIAGSASDRSLGALQVLGTPGNDVIFTSLNDNAFGGNTRPNPNVTVDAGDWGGLSFRTDFDRADNRALWEDRAIFLSYVNHAHLRYGGGDVPIGSVRPIVAPINMIEARPTVSNNLVELSADAAMAADPNSFAETTFHAPRFQQAGLFTTDYVRIGPDIHGNRVRGNTIDGLLVRVRTPAGDALKPLTVSARFDDKDIVHVITENLVIQGTPGGPVLDEVVLSPTLVTLTAGTGGTLAAGTYNYRFTLVDAAGNEGPGSDPTANVTVGANGTVFLGQLPPAPTGFIARRIYRSDNTGSPTGAPYVLVAEINAFDTTFLDTGATAGGLLDEPVLDVSGVTLTAGTGGVLGGGTYNYRIALVDAGGNEGAASVPTSSVTVGFGGTVTLNNLPAAPAGFVARRIYRSDNTGSPSGAPYVLVAQLNATATTFVDIGTDQGTLLSEAGDRLRPRLDARLAIDPSVIVKLGGARIDVGISAQFIAEGREGREVIITSVLDDSYGASGSSDTSGDGSTTTPAGGNWGGIYASPTSTLSIDHARVSYGGGVTPLGGSAAGFNVIEIHQADARITSSVFENNADGQGGQAPNNRLGRGFNDESTIFVRGSQAIIVDNIIRNSDGAAISINVNALNHRLVEDTGRSTGPSERFVGFEENQGALVRLNRLENNALNGMRVRGETLTTQSVWDDRDIVHVVEDTIFVPDFHVYGGLRLTSSITESLVVKFGPGAGLVATGRPLDIDDRIGGAVQIVGQPGRPVVLTSINDDTVGAGFDPQGNPQVDTNNDGVPGGGILALPSPGTPFTVTPSLIGQDLVNAMILRPLPAGVTISGSTLVSAGNAAGVYDGGDSVPLQIPLRGAILTTGDAVLPASNTSTGFTGVTGTPPDADLDALIAPSGFSTTEATSLTLTIDVAVGSGIRSGSFLFQFGSEEFSEFVGSPFNDVLGGFANGGAATNFLRDALGNLISVNSAFFDLDNETGTLLNIEYDGMTSGLLAQFPLVEGTNTIKIAVGDAFDTILDSGILMTDLRFSTGDVGTGGVTGAQLPGAGDWEGILLDQFSHDRNVGVVVEREPTGGSGSGTNGTPDSAQFLGTLAKDMKSGDENLRLGFEVQGLLRSAADVDVYSFEALSQTEVWFDIDRSKHSLDTIIEVLDGSGKLIARSDNSEAEWADPTKIFRDPSFVDLEANPLARTDFFRLDEFGTNPRDAGLRVVLPGPQGVTGPYFVRISNPSGVSSSGAYQLQVRLGEQYEVPGSTVQYADIRFATRAIEVLGMPGHSPLLGEASEQEARTVLGVNDTIGTAQQLGNLLNSDQAALGIAGALANFQDIDMFRFEVVWDSTGATIDNVSTIFDVDYSDGVGGPDLSLSVFDEFGRLILTGLDSNVADDLASPLSGADLDDLRRGSVGVLDSFIGSANLLPRGVVVSVNGQLRVLEGTYYLAVTDSARRAVELEQFFVQNPVNPLLRLQPIESLIRIVEDHIETDGGGTALPPVTLDFLTENGVVPFHLGDVVLYVSQEIPGTNNARIFTVNPFTGQGETVVGSVGRNIGDITVRDDGLIYAFAHDFPEGGPISDAAVGGFLQISPGNASFTVLGDDGIETYQLNPGSNPPADQRVNNGAGVGIDFEAVTYFGGRLYAIGSRNDSAPFGVQRTTNILYVFDPDTGLADSLGQDRQGPNRYLGAGTQIVERGVVETDLGTLIVTGVTEPNEFSPTVPPVIPAPRDPGDTISAILDGLRFQVVPNFGASRTYEIDLGATAIVNVNPDAMPADGLGQRHIQDGDYLRVENQFLQFDTGWVVEVEPGLSPTDIVQNVRDGDRIRINLSGGGGITLELEDQVVGNGTGGNRAVVFNSLTTTRQQLVDAIVASVNTLPAAFNVTAAELPGTGRISFIRALPTGQNIGSVVTTAFDTDGLEVASASGFVPVLDVPDGFQFDQGDFFDLRHTFGPAASQTARFVFAVVGAPAPALAAEVQTLQITGSPTGGTFDLTLRIFGLGDVPVQNISYDPLAPPTAADIQNAVDAALIGVVPGYANGDLVVSGTDVTTGLTFTYSGASLIGGNHGQLKADLTGLTGGTPAAVIATTAQGDTRIDFTGGDTGATVAGAILTAINRASEVNDDFNVRVRFQGGRLILAGENVTYTNSATNPTPLSPITFQTQTGTIEVAETQRADTIAAAFAAELNQLAALAPPPATNPPITVVATSFGARVGIGNAGQQGPNSGIDFSGMTIVNGAPIIVHELSADGSTLSREGLNTGTPGPAPTLLRLSPTVTTTLFGVNLNADAIAQAIEAELQLNFANLSATQQVTPNNDTISFRNGTINLTRPLEPDPLNPNAHPFDVIDSGTGGEVTGMAPIAGQLYAVDDQGGLYRLDNPVSRNMTSTLIRQIVDPVTGNPVDFAALAAGPPTVENGAYAATLFGVSQSIDPFTNTARLYAFDTSGNLLPIFLNGAVSVDILVPPNGFDIHGLAFSTLDQNLWHETPVTPFVTGATPMDVRVGAAGSVGQAITVDEQQGAAGHGGRSSFHFGLGNVGGVARTIDFPGGAHGALESNTFSLKGYSPQDKPALYFNYFAETENAGAFDALRVYISDGADFTNNPATLANDGWVLVAGNSGGGQTIFDYAVGDPNQSWRQVRIPLDAFAGMEGLRLRFEFSTSGDFDFGRVLTTGSELRAMPGADLRDGDIVTISELSNGNNPVNFEFDLGFTLVLPGGVQIVDQQQFTINGVVFEFDSGNGLVSGGVGVNFNAAMSARDVALSVRQSINNSALAGTVVPIINDNRLNLLGAAAVNVSLAPRLTVDGAPGVAPGNVAVVVNAGMTADEVALALSDQMENRFGSLATPNPPAQAIPEGLLGNDTRANSFDTGIGLGAGGRHTFTGTIGDNAALADPADDVDFVRLDIQGGVTVNITVDSTSPGLDSIIRIFDSISSNQLVLPIDNAGTGGVEIFSFTAPATGTYFIGVSGFPNNNYLPDFEGSGNGFSTGNYELTFDFGDRIRTASKLYNDVIQVIGHVVLNDGPLVLRDFLSGDSPNNNANPTNNPYNVLSGYNSNRRGQNNLVEGIYLDDIVIGFTERGERATAAQINTAFTPLNDPFITPRNYQVEIRRGPGYDDGAEFRSFDTNDRHVDGFAILALPGDRLVDGATFTIGDGLDDVVFEYNDTTIPVGQPGFGVTPGHFAISFQPTDSDFVVARRIRDAVNSSSVQSVINVTAALSDGVTSGTIDPATGRPLSTSVRVNLFGAAVLSDVDPLEVVKTTTIAEELAAALIGSGVTLVPGSARLISGTHSAGFFVNGFSSIGIAEGIILSTGDARDAAGPNVSDSTSGTSSLTADALLDNEFGVTTLDTTALQFDFDLDVAGEISFQYVFASEEYNEFAGFINDAFGFFIDGTNVALVPGTSTPVSVSSINGGNPLLFGTGVNEFFYRNNDPGDGGEFLDKVEYDGFTTILTARANLPAGRHTLRLTVSDISDTVFDSAVFVKGGSLQTGVPPILPDGSRGFRFEEEGDQSRLRQQGQIIIANNVITDAAEWGIFASAGARTRLDLIPEGGALPHAGAPINTSPTNPARLAAGVVIMNNVVAGGGSGGIFFGGDPSTVGSPVVPFGRIVNNTVWGVGGGDIAIQVGPNASPTLMNNIVANAGVGIQVAGSSSSTIVQGTVYKGNGTNAIGVSGGSGLGDGNPFVLAATDPLFVDPARGNFYLAAGSKAIDSSVGFADERAGRLSQLNTLAISPSPILAPELDVFGQVRVDDSNTPNVGTGEKPFLDRGAIDRVDFTGPTAVLQNPVDNDAQDTDPDATEVEVGASRILTDFRIQLVDGVDPNNPSDGTGIDDSTVFTNAVIITRTDGSGTRTLVPATDYIFVYDATNNVIRLNPAEGLWLPGTYVLTLDNSIATGIKDIAGNRLLANQANGETKFTISVGVPDEDFGDAPDPLYPTQRVNNGARHKVVTGFYLGAGVDTEFDGQQSPLAAGDGADEDGVAFATSLLAGQTTTITVTASQAGLLDAWIDFNNDGDWDDAGEQIFASRSLAAGPNALPVLLNTTAGARFARFRFSTAGGLSPTGAAADGEVEDYRLVITDQAPFQNPVNRFDVTNNGVVDFNDVLAVVNDIRAHGFHDVPSAIHPTLTFPFGYVDVDGNARVDFRDVLAVVNYLRNPGSPEGEGEAPAGFASGEGELAAPGFAAGEGEGPAAFYAAGEGEADRAAQPASAPIVVSPGAPVTAAPAAESNSFTTGSSPARTLSPRRPAAPLPAGGADFGNSFYAASLLDGPGQHRGGTPASFAGPAAHDASRSAAAASPSDAASFARELDSAFERYEGEIDWQRDAEEELDELFSRVVPHGFALPIDGRRQAELDQEEQLAGSV